MAHQTLLTDSEARSGLILVYPVSSPAGLRRPYFRVCACALIPSFLRLRTSQGFSGAQDNLVSLDRR